VANSVSFKGIYVIRYNVLQELFLLFPNILYIDLTSRLMVSLRAKCIAASTETAATQRKGAIDFSVTTHLGVHFSGHCRGSVRINLDFPSCGNIVHAAVIKGYCIRTAGFKTQFSFSNFQIAAVVVPAEINRRIAGGSGIR